MLTVAVDSESPVWLVDVRCCYHGHVSCVLVHLHCLTHFPQFSVHLTLHLRDQTLKSAAWRALNSLSDKSEGLLDSSHLVEYLHSTSQSRWFFDFFCNISYPVIVGTQSAVRSTLLPPVCLRMTAKLLANKSLLSQPHTNCRKQKHK